MMFFKKLFFVVTFCLCSLPVFSQAKEYHKAYYENGNIKEEGWLIGTQKNGYWKYYYKNGNFQKEGRYKNNKENKYWYFYHENGSKIKEGHFLYGKQSNWWLYYDNMGKVDHKCQLKNNLKDGYCLIYKMQRIVKASKYKKGKKIKEWTDLSSFKRDNNLNDLRK